jgi:two-component system response regulator HydG
MSLSTLPFLGASRPLAQFLEDLDLAAGSEATVLLLGESGTGKSAAARLLHERGARRDGPLVEANLAAMSPTLIEAALFGHERGAFTDAHRARPGLFAHADGGTVVLDDVDVLPVEVQVKLLRVLQERVIDPLGSDAPVAVDVRVVATTNRDLLREVEEGRFRQDLYYRLAVVSLELPPLRVRTGDLEELVPGLCERVAERSRLPTRTVSAAAMERRAAQPWPGNVRELENALERVLALAGPDARERPVEPDELDFLEESRQGAADEVAQAALAHGLTVEELTRAMMERALSEHRGNVSAAARRVGLTRRAFDYRMARQPEETEEES